MTDTAKKAKFSVGAFLCYALSVIFAWACYFVYAYLPSSDEFTNSIEYSGKETVYYFGSSFASGIISVLIFTIMVYTFRKYFYKLSFADRKIGNYKIKESTLEWISLISSIIIFAVILTSTVLSFLYFKTCLFDMPEVFLAPTDGTVFKTYEYVIFANTVVHTVFFFLTAVKMAGIHWLDAIVSFIISIFKKIKKIMPKR